MDIILFFELMILFTTVILLFLLCRPYSKESITKILRRYVIIFIGVLIFEIFTSPLWYNNHLDSWAYLYNDVSWILTLGWSCILLLSMDTVDYLFKVKETKKFFLYLLFAVVIGIIAESFILSIDVRSYSFEVLAVMSGVKVFMRTPVEALYYMPAFMALIIGFTKYFEMVFDRRFRKITPSFFEEEKKQLNSAIPLKSLTKNKRKRERK